MYVESGEKLEKYSSQNFDFYFQVLENALLNGFECRVSPFFAYVPRRCIFWIVRYDASVRYRLLN